MVEIRSLLTIGIAVISLMAVTWPRQSVPKLYWNMTPSVPIGLYMMTNQMPVKGDFAIVSLPEATAALAEARGYLPARFRLIKPVVAGSGDTVCRSGLVVTIDGRLLAVAEEFDTRQRPLPQWDGCHRLTRSQLFVISSSQSSFDSRYIGPILVRHVWGTAVPIWTR